MFSQSPDYVAIEQLETARPDFRRHRSVEPEGKKPGTRNVHHTAACDLNSL